MPSSDGAGKSRELDIPLVALGASAGGLEPLEDFFQAVTEHSGTAFVIVQHLSPDFRSMMNEILSRQSSLPIKHIDEGMTLQANTIYLNRPNMYVELRENTFRTFRYQEEDGLPHLPIDRLFQSLADRDPTRTLGIVLSGSGTDGTRGAQSLHRAGAAVLVQSTTEASFVSMPRSVLMSGAVDRVLDAADMPDAVKDIFTYGKRGSVAQSEKIGPGIQSILNNLELHHNVDFTNYKPTNVHRRIERRQHLRGHASLEEYSELLSQSPEAIDELYQDLLIGVTSFFRDPDAVDSLRKLALDKLAAEDSETPIKVWVPGCASGEEAYTIAIELTEALRAAGRDRRFRIIATDIHSQSIEFASRGVYEAEKVRRIPEGLRERYFVESNGSFMVDPSLRQRIIFSVHNVLGDPPFMNLDLVSCRNLLIYLNEDPQAGVISNFLFGLKKGGYLLLGGSESIGKFSSAFKTVDSRWRIYRKQSDMRGIHRDTFPSRAKHSQLLTSPGPGRSSDIDLRRGSIGELGELRSRENLIRSYDILLKKFAPSSILLTIDGKVLNWFGAAALFIDTKNNLAEWSVQEIVNPELHFAINVGIEKLRQGLTEPHSRSTRVTLQDGEVRDCTVELVALGGSTEPDLVLAKIEIQATEIADGLPETAQSDAKGLLAGRGTAGNDEDTALLTGRIHELERDLRLTEQTLQHVTERLEASGEELQASNEELQASNEELQASNEELQSSNEELHAVNEELVTLSAEHESKIEQLSELNANTELAFRMLSTGIILLDGQNQILRFSSLIERDFLLQPHDVNRALSTVGPRLAFVDLEAFLSELNEKGGTDTISGVHDGRELIIEARQVPIGPSENRSQGTLLIFRWP